MASLISCFCTMICGGSVAGAGIVEAWKFGGVSTTVGRIGIAARRSTPVVFVSELLNDGLLLVVIAPEFRAWTKIAHHRIERLDLIAFIRRWRTFSRIFRKVLAKKP